MPGWEPFTRNVRARSGELIVNISPLVEALSLEHGDELAWAARIPHSTRLELYWVDEAPPWAFERQIQRRNAEFVLNLPSVIASLLSIDPGQQIEFTGDDECLAQIRY